MAKQEPITLIQFQQKLHSQEAYHQHLYQVEWPNGFVCPKFGHNRAYEIKTTKLPLYECTSVSIRLPLPSEQSLSRQGQTFASDFGQSF